MEPILLVDEIDFPTTISHTLKKSKKLFPFITNNTAHLKGNFNIILSDLARLTTKFKLNSKKLDELEFHHLENSNRLSEFIAQSEQIQFGSEEAKVDFIRFMDQYLFNENSINIIHMYLYNIIGESEAKQSVLKNTAEFIRDVLIARDSIIEDVFKNKETDNILTRLIISQIEQLVIEKSSKDEQNHSDILPEFTMKFREDLKFLMKHRDYLIANFELITNYYTFMYAVQCVKKFGKYSNTDFNEVEPFYFALEWEGITKKRLVASSLQGYKFVKEQAIDLFPHEYTLRLLSYNIFNKGLESKEVMDYATLYKRVESLGEQAIVQFKEDLKALIKKYIAWSTKNSIDTHIDFEESVDGLFHQLFALVKNKMHLDARLKYSQSVDYLGQGVFLKSRGSLGNLLNVSHDFLILMTSVVVKDERMPFKTLLEQFEKRGIIFDRYSIEEIIDLFNNHNILDKKSDSGDVQYVKPIL